MLVIEIHTTIIVL